MIIHIMVSCQVNGCATEVSYPLDMVRLYEGQPLCQGCFEEELYQGDWCELPKISIKDLSE